MTDNTDQHHQHTASVQEQRVAKVYAEALLNGAEKQGQGDAVLDELDALVGEAFRADPKIEVFFSSAAIGRRAKDEVIRKSFAGRVSQLFLNFLFVLNEHARLDLLRPICQAARDLRDERARRIRVQVRTAFALADDQRERLTQELRQNFHLEPVLETQIDPALLGGMVIKVGDWLYDGSVRSSLDTLRRQLIERSSHEIQSRRDRFSS
jgi:F-type H+-transporting ATPase subunit delta